MTRTTSNELMRLYSLLVSFLGEAKSGFNGEEMQLQFACPHCVEIDGPGEKMKYNLEINFSKQVFQCWKCSSSDDTSMRGPLIRLIRRYGTAKDVQEYKNILYNLKESKYYNFEFDLVSILSDNASELNELFLPQSYTSFKKGFTNENITPLLYLKNRGLTWDIIEQYNMGYTGKDDEDKKMSYRIIIPSYDEKGLINYWVGRDYIGKTSFRYMNPNVKKEEIIFNEQNIQWDADITLCEGVFDAITIPNSIPMLGKALNENFKLYWSLFERANANVNIFLDGDAQSSIYKIAHALNQGRLKGKIRGVFVNEEYDPSLIFQRFGRKGILQCLGNAKKIEERY